MFEWFHPSKNYLPSNPTVTQPAKSSNMSKSSSVKEKSSPFFAFHFCFFEGDFKIDLLVDSDGFKTVSPWPSTASLLWKEKILSSIVFAIKYLWTQVSFCWPIRTILLIACKNKTYQFSLAKLACTLSKKNMTNDSKCEYWLIMTISLVVKVAMKYQTTVQPFPHTYKSSEWK